VHTGSAGNPVSACSVGLHRQPSRSRGFAYADCYAYVDSDSDHGPADVHPDTDCHADVDSNSDCGPAVSDAGCHNDEERRI
jgi:hypothetical protein